MADELPAAPAPKAAGLIGDGTAKRNVAPYFGESETDEDEDETSAPIGAAGGEDDDMDGLRMETFDPKRRMLLPASALRKIRGEALGELGGFTVYAVDGVAVRLLDVDFYDGANPGRYVYVPDGEIWIDSQKAAAPTDLACCALHHAVEALVMAEGATHDAGHCAAHIGEELLRKAFAAGWEEAADPAAALRVAARWLPGQVDAAKGFAAEHAARQAPGQPGAENEDENGPASERGEKPGEPDPDSTRTPGAKPAKPGAKK